jgi:hypothetical protein
MKIKEPYRTGIIIMCTISITLGTTYILMPEQYRTAVKDFIKRKLGKKQTQNTQP